MPANRIKAEHGGSLNSTSVYRAKGLSDY